MRLIDVGVSIVATVLLFAAQPAAAATDVPEVALAAPNADRVCSERPSVDLVHIQTTHSMSSIDAGLLRSWAACFREEAQQLAAEASTNSTISTGTATRLSQLAQQASVAAELTDTYVAALDAPAMQLINAKAETLNSAAGSVKTNATNLANQANNAVGICRILSATQTAAGTITTAAANPNSAGQKVTFVIVNAGLGMLSQIICNSGSQAVNSASGSTTSSVDKLTNASADLNNTLQDDLK